MSLDPRTPILVGGGQVNERTGGVEPVELIARAAHEAAAEAGTGRLLKLVDSVRIVRMLSWRYRDPGTLVAERIGASPRHTGYTGNGGSGPQALVNSAAEDIAAGNSSVILIGGSEAWRTRMKLRAAGQRPEWTIQNESVPKAAQLIEDVPMAAESETRIGLDRPVYVYPLFEQALRISAGRSMEEHREVIGAMWARFSKIAATNPYAWIQQEYTADEIVTPSPENRWVSWPYTKLLNSNNMVEQGAALVLCSVEVANRLGISRDRWVFPQAGTEAADTSEVVARGSLDSSPAIRGAGSRVLGLSEIGIDDVGYVDLYSCFPSAVQVAAGELGLPLGDPGRPLTQTGGLTFAGGPWNNYSTHAIATLITRLRECPGEYGLVTANSGYLTKHAVGVYRTEPPRHGFRRENVQKDVDAEPTMPCLTAYEGQGRVESWTVTHGRDGKAERAFVAARTNSGERTLVSTADPEALERMITVDVARVPIVIGLDGRFRFND